MDLHIWMASVGYIIPFAIPRAQNAGPESKREQEIDKISEGRLV